MSDLNTNLEVHPEPAVGDTAQPGPPDSAAGAPPPAPVAESGSRNRVLDILSRYTILLVLVLSIVVFSIIEPSTFFTVTNFKSMATQQVVIVLLGVAATIPLIAGEFDVSVGYVLGIVQALTIGFMSKAGSPIWLAAIIGVAAGTHGRPRQRAAGGQAQGQRAHRHPGDGERADRPHHLVLGRRGDLQRRAAVVHQDRTVPAARHPVPGHLRRRGRRGGGDVLHLRADGPPPVRDRRQSPRCAAQWDQGRPAADRRVRRLRLPQRPGRSVDRLGDRDRGSHPGSAVPAARLRVRVPGRDRVPARALQHPRHAGRRLRPDGSRHRATGARGRQLVPERVLRAGAHGGRGGLRAGRGAARAGRSQVAAAARATRGRREPRPESDGPASPAPGA